MGTFCASTDCNTLCELDCTCVQHLCEIMSALYCKHFFKLFPPYWNPPIAEVLFALSVYARKCMYVYLVLQKTCERQSILCYLVSSDGAIVYIVCLYVCGFICYCRGHVWKTQPLCNSLQWQVLFTLRICIVYVWMCTWKRGVWKLMRLITLLNYVGLDRDGACAVLFCPVCSC
jgi:hypothetical protein